MKRRILSFVSVVLVLMMLLGACANQQSDPGNASAGSFLVTDLTGTVSEFDEPAETIVSLTASNTEILFALGLGDKVIGKDDYSYYPDEANNIPVMGDYNGPNIETIVEAGADVVFSSTKLQADAAQSLRDLGITVIASEAGTFEEIFTSIELIGKVCGADDAASALIASMRERIAAVEANVGANERPRVYYCMSYGEYGDWTGGKGSFINEIMALAGGNCVTDDVDVQWANLSLEQVVERDPEIIFLSSYYTAEELAALPGYGDTSAAKSGNIIVINPDIVERPGPRIVDALEEIAAAIKAYHG